MSTLVIATHNAGKLAELRELLAPLSLELMSLTELNIPEPEETGLSFIENAILKARHAAQLSGLPALADDSGLTVDALEGAPGIYSARYSGIKSDAANIDTLLSALESVPDGQRSASFYCVIAMLRHANDPMPIVVAGRWQGEIVRAPKGESGFGYDPVFYIPALQKTAAELSKSEKNALSHRGLALQQLLKVLQTSR